MKKELLIKTCIRCKLVFRTDKEHETVCPDCQKFSQKNRKQKKETAEVVLNKRNKTA